MGEHSHHLKYQVVMKENRRIYRENCALKNVNSDLTSKLKEVKSKVENILRELNEIPQVCGLRDALEIKGREVSRTEIKSNNAPAEKFEGSLNPSAMEESENLQDDHDEDTLDDLLDESVNVQVTITEDIPVVQKENIEENIVFKAEMNESAEHESIEENPTKVSFSCVKCKYIGESLEDLNKHMKRKHIKDSLKKNDLGFYQCTSCTYATKSQGCFILHLQNHEGLVHDCSQCPYKSFSEYNLRVHKRREHGDKRFNCEKCSYSTAVKFRLKTHIKSVHDGVKVSKEFRYICDKCDYKTHLSTYLKNHLQIHGDVIHFCDKCTHSTPSAYNLSKHIKRRHADVC